MKIRISLISLISLISVTAFTPIYASANQNDKTEKKTVEKANAKNAKDKKMERAEQVVRDSARLETVKSIAVVPILIQLRFDRDKRIPDPGRMHARIASAALIPQIIAELGKSSQYTFLPEETVSHALAELNWSPSDLYVVKHGSSWESPAEVVTGSKKDEAILLDKRDDMKRTPEELSLYRFRLHDATDAVTGLASYKLGVFAQPDMAKMKELAAKLGVDAVLFIQVTDVEVHESSTAAGTVVDIFIGPFGQRLKSTRIHLHGTLVSAKDSAILWRARARGIKSHTTGILTAGKMKGDLDKAAVEGTADATEILMSDLCSGTGIPHK